MDNVKSPLNDFNKVIELLTLILNKVDEETNVVWTRFDTPEELIADLQQNIKKLQSNDFDVLDKLNLMFGPTATYQELSISNGWGDEYLYLSKQFDEAYENLKRDHQ